MPARALNRVPKPGSNDPQKIGRDACLPQEQAIRSGKIFFRGLTHGHYPGTRLPPKILPGLSSLGYWDAVGVQDWGMEFHRNEGIEVVFLETGKMDFTVEGELHNLSAGSLTVTRPWERHCHGVPHVGPGRLHWLILDVQASRPNHAWKWPEWIVLSRRDIKELNRRMQRGRTNAFQASPEIALSFRKLADCLLPANYCRHLSQIMLSINQIILSLLTVPESSQPLREAGNAPRGQPVEKFFSELRGDPRIFAKRWTLESMARHCGIGATTLVKYCHDLTNTSPMDYLNRCRLEWAAGQLRNESPASVTALAFQAGFSSSSYFATQFRRKYRTTPIRYRQVFQNEGLNKIRLEV